MQNILFIFNISCIIDRLGEVGCMSDKTIDANSGSLFYTLKFFYYKDMTFYYQIISIP